MEDMEFPCRWSGRPAPRAAPARPARPVSSREVVAQLNFKLLHISLLRHMEERTARYIKLGGRSRRARPYLRSYDDLEIPFC
ncbi:hypothetical protein EVAR_14960_1 [Eumeta japonica]|uniref:Uncharacterized protein n=1 Tax=Eumeta variegata TaxID=151549 RepID=A0A4C1XQB8_EUMVA|nr:hypothetical protein EVAR_14960_1 [Eumeta japonica]